MITNLIPKNWAIHLAPEFSKPYFTQLEESVKKAYNTTIVYPPQNMLFSALNLCSTEEIKVVILGQDPYHEPNQAHGLAFSVLDGCKRPGSLAHIFEEIEIETNDKITQNNNLTRWAKQGVLLLNTTLTVEAHKAGSHRNLGWQNLSDAIISLVNNVAPHAVFMLWGGDAHKKAALIDDKRHLIIRTTHPSGLSWGKSSNPNKMVDSFRRNGFGRNKNNAFWGSMQFVEANKFLNKYNIQPINWL